VSLRPYFLIYLLLDSVYDTIAEMRMFLPVRVSTAEQLDTLLHEIIKRVMKSLARLGYLLEEHDRLFLAETDTGESRDRRRERLRCQAWSGGGTEMASACAHQ
jgi:hypothetical protein